MPSTDVPLISPATLTDASIPFGDRAAIAGPRSDAARPLSNFESARRSDNSPAQTTGSASAQASRAAPVLRSQLAPIARAAPGSHAPARSLKPVIPPAVP